jgi:hypothetical protein
VDVCTKIQRRGVTIHGNFNNHYAGFGPASVQLFRTLCADKGLQIPLPAPLPIMEPLQVFWRMSSLIARLQARA